MEQQNDYKSLFSTSFDLDEKAFKEALRERSDTPPTTIGEQDVRLRLHEKYENRIALAKGKSTLLRSGDPALACYDIPLVCVVHPHPACRILWARLTVDLSQTVGGRIRDMAPREVGGDKPVELKTSVGIGLKFETVANVIGATVNPTYMTSRTVYYPEVISSGPGFSKGYWDFRGLASANLHVNRELRLLVSVSADVPPQARFNLQAEVTLDGIRGMIPLVARRGEINEIYRLD